MSRFTVREWGYLSISDAGTDNVVTRAQANRLLLAARRAQPLLRAAEGESQHILLDGVQKLRAQQVVGVLAAPGISLEILPKIDGIDDGKVRSNLIRMLARTKNIAIAYGELTGLDWQNKDLLEILIRLFCDKLFEAVHRGLSRQYLSHEDDLTALRGRLNVKRQFTVLSTSPQRIACRYYELSANIALNQILKAAIDYLRRLSRHADNRRRLTQLKFAFADVATVPRERLLWDKVILDRTSTAYHELLRLAELLLGDRFQTTSVGDTRGFSLLFEMNSLFEEYIGLIILRSFMYVNSLAVTLQKPRRYALFDMSANKERFMMKPDIVIHSLAKPVMIIDTKWKRLTHSIDDPKHGVLQSDVYQMMAYAQIYQVQHLLLLYPHHCDLGIEEGILYENKINGIKDSWLYIGTIGLDNLDGIQSRAAALVSKILSKMELPACAA
jgi:5-methylcytosine-specific restriction enzyme subunit McrC